jgi:hypothetical protein
MTSVLQSSPLGTSVRITPGGFLGCSLLLTLYHDAKIRPLGNDVDPTYDRDGLAIGPAAAGITISDGDKSDSGTSIRIADNTNRVATSCEALQIPHSDS